MMKSKLFAVAALALAGSLGGGMAQAHGDADVQWSVTIGSPVGVPIYTQPVPVYSRPAPVYVQPVPVYGHPVPVYQAVPVYRSPHGHHGHSRRWDADRDGIPNRHDRIYNPRWDRDGDGVPNRHDRWDNRRHDRHGDGIPNWRERGGEGHWRGR